MAYNHGSMLPPRTVEEFLVPGYAKLTSFLNSKGVDIIVVPLRDGVQTGEG